MLVSIAACKDSSRGSDKPLYNTSAETNDTAGVRHDSIVAAAAAADTARDSAAIRKANGPSTQTHGGVPAGTIDSGMNNAGAEKHKH